MVGRWQLVKRSLADKCAENRDRRVLSPEWYVHVTPLLPKPRNLLRRVGGKIVRNGDER